MCGSGFLKVRNWDRFQHYKDRNPIWIKLATDTFQNYEFNHLDDASKLLAICIWTLAARSEVSELGSIPNDLRWIKNQCGLGDSITDKTVQTLITKGFISCDSNPLADGYQNACLEKNREEEIREEKKPPKSPKGGRVVVDYQSFMDTWNSNIEGTPFPSIVAMTDKRKKGIRDLLTDHPDAISMIAPVINHLSGIEFFTGENKNKWVANFDYLLQKGKLIEFYEKSKNKHKPIDSSMDARSRSAYDEQNRLISEKLKGVRQ